MNSNATMQGTLTPFGPNDDKLLRILSLPSMPWAIIMENFLILFYYVEPAVKTPKMIFSYPIA